jgi:hypothetical protein
MFDVRMLLAEFAIWTILPRLPVMQHTAAHSPLLAYVRCSMYHRSMDQIPQGETNDELIAAAGAAGYAVSKRQLAEWHRAGLLPTPQRVPRVGTSPGMRSVYPVGTTAQLLTLCHCRERHPHRLEDLRWCLWWMGHDAQVSTARAHLERAATTWREYIDQLRHLMATNTDDPAELSEALLDLLDRSATERIARKTLRRVRKRVGREQFPTVLRVFLEVAAGTFTGYRVDAVTGTDEEERRVVEAALGLDRARTDRLAAAGPWFTGDSGAELATLSRNLREHPPCMALPAASDEELGRVRDEARSMIEMFAGFSAILDRMYGWGAFGFSTIAQSFREMRPLDQAFLLLFWQMLRMWGLGENMDLLVGVAQQWQTLWSPLFQGLEALQREVPATAETLDPKRAGAALRKPKVMEQLQAAWQALRAEHGEELLAFFARHPEIPTPPADDGDMKTAE